MSNITYVHVCYRCDKEPTQWKGEENREALSQALKDQALAVADKEEAVKWVAGTVRGKVRELATGLREISQYSEKAGQL